MQTPFGARLPLSRAAVDRDHAGRTRPLAELCAEPGAAALVLHEGRVLMSGPASVAWIPGSGVAERALTLYLGRDREPSAAPVPASPRLAVILEDSEAAAALAATTLGRAAAPEDWGMLRALGDRLDPRDAAFATEALALANWHHATGFSPASGSPTTVEMGGWVRRDAEGREHFPRTDTAVIVAVTDDEDRLLLGSNALWETRRFSLLAGFVEPGESFEQAVVREVLEESGLLVAEPRYLGSQPWPFPASLMVGFRARLAAGESRPDGEEIVELRWLSRAELAAAVVAGELLPPGAVSIARALIEDWFGGPLPEPAA